MRLSTAALLALIAWCAGFLVPPPAPPRFVQEDVRIPAHNARATLAITILRPYGRGPFGAVILNHGVPLDDHGRRIESPAMLLHTAAAFAQRGYAVLMPLRRGFGATGGEFAEDSGSCANADYHAGESEAAADVLAAYAFARRLPYVDSKRMILAGQSAGGVAALYSAAQDPEGLLAVLAFGAGRGADPEHPGVPCAAGRLAAVFDEVGRALRVPALLYYAQNDLFFGPAASKAWFERLKAGGAPAQYVLQPPFGANGHYVFTDAAGSAQWLPAVERFLRQQGIAFGDDLDRHHTRKL
jgi:dienelactone hydrolase